MHRPKAKSASEIGHVNEPLMCHKIGNVLECDFAIIYMG
jgi:hypothetical protein